MNYDLSYEERYCLQGSPLAPYLTRIPTECRGHLGEVAKYIGDVAARVTLDHPRYPWVDSWKTAKAFTMRIRMHIWHASLALEQERVTFIPEGAHSCAPPRYDRSRPMNNPYREPAKKPATWRIVRCADGWYKVQRRDEDGGWFTVARNLANDAQAMSRLRSEQQGDKVVYEE